MDEIELLKSENETLKKKIKTLELSAGISAVREQERIDYEESQIRFRTVFESSKLGNKIISSDLIILQVNPAMVQLLGYMKKEEIIGSRILDFAPEEYHADWKVLQENLWNRFTTSFTLETCLRRKDGVIINCRVTSILFQDGGKTLGYTIIEDITEQHKLRRQKEDFISVASHELKTPVTTLRATLQLMNRIIGKEIVSDQLQKLIRNAEVNTVKLGNLVINLLDSTKLEQGQLALNITKFKISKAIEKCCNHILLSSKYKIIQTGDLSLEIFADEEKIDQVLVNLVSNAVKYAPDSKEIYIHIEKLEKDVKISVSDNGPGISPVDLSKLFQRYFRVNKNGNNSAGLGLGLYISSEIIKRHNGKMGVESDLGKGSTFWFTVPLEP